MPSRKPADQDLILAAYRETNNAREVSRRLGLHYNTVIAALRRERRECLRCGNSVVLGKKHCPECLEKLATDARAKRKVRQRAGICVLCDEPLCPQSTMYCSTHRLAHLEASSTNKEKVRKQAPLTGVTTDKERESYLRWKYGPDAVDCWRELRGLCAICSRHHLETPVHLHHIDENNKNNVRSNFTLLCFDCHQLVTKLLQNLFAPQILEWVRKTYPDLKL